VLLRTWRASTAAGTAVALGCLGLTVDNLRRLRTPQPDPPAPAEPVTVLVPARDEGDRIGRCITAVRTALDAVPDGLVLVLDDDSSDGTAEVVRRAAAADARVRLLTGAPPPPGWLGKPWACQQLADVALESDARGGSDGVLVFVDADVHLEAQALVAAVQMLREGGLVMVCPYPRQEAITWAERLVQPLLQWSWLTTLPLDLAERSPRPSLAAANGQLLVIDATAYAAMGGHRQVRAEVLDDLALLRAVKRTGGRGAIADGTSLASCRMYDGWPALRDGYAKSLWSAFGSRRGATAAMGLLGLTYVLPAVAAAGGSRVGLVGYGAGVAGRALVARRVQGRVAPDALLHPASVLPLAWLTVDSWRRRTAVQWKGRPVGGPVTGPSEVGLVRDPA
jgi:hypothetical protein